MFLKYAYRPVLTTDTRKNQYARAFYQVYSGVLALVSEVDVTNKGINNRQGADYRRQTAGGVQDQLH